MTPKANIRIYQHLSHIQKDPWFMGEFRFQIPTSWNLDSFHAHSIHVLGLDGIPWPCRISTGKCDVPDRKILSVTRNNDSSGRVYIHFPFKEKGEMLICTGTLPVREQPYELLVELARGTVNRLRNQLSIWQEGGLVISDEVHQQVDKATRTLGRAILTKDVEARDQYSEECIELAIEAIFGLSDDFGKQISTFRRNHQELSNFWLAAVASDSSDLTNVSGLDAFELVQVTSLESVQPSASPAEPQTSKRLILGPWLDASVGGMPENLVKLDDFPVRRNQVISELREGLSRLPSETSLLHVVRGLNGIGHRHLSHPQQIQLTVDLLRQVEESRVELPTMVSFDFPWAERLAGAVGGIHPLQIADSLLRQGLEISVLGLEINLDYWPNGSTLRDPLQWIDLVDVWAQLGLPIILFLRVPFDDVPLASGAIAQDQHVNSSPSNLTNEHRVKFLQTTIPMMIARPAVYGMVWSQCQDTADPRYPKSGIFEDGKLRPAVAPLITDIRQHIDG